MAIELGRTLCLKGDASCGKYLAWLRAALLALTILEWTEGAEQPKPDPAVNVVHGNNQFALELYGKLQQQDGNLFCSPYSISTALGMTYAGARGDTADQMAATLHFGKDQEKVHPAFGQLIKQINGDGKRAATS